MEYSSGVAVALPPVIGGGPVAPVALPVVPAAATPTPLPFRAVPTPVVRVSLHLDIIKIKACFPKLLDTATGDLTYEKYKLPSPL